MTCPFCISCHVDACSDKLVLFIKLDIDIFFGEMFFGEIDFDNYEFLVIKFFNQHLGNQKFGD
jgi:hypothetical protein